MEHRLIDKIDTALQGIPGSRILSEEEAQRLVTAVAANYGLDLEGFLSWERVEGTAYPYDDPAEWGLLLASMLGLFTGDVYMVVTNETYFPWPVIGLPAADVQSLLLELPHFEFFIFDETMDRMVVDTHYNELIVLEK